MREMVAHVRTVLDVDAARLVDEYTHEPAARVHLAVDELVAQRGQRAFQHFVQLHRHDLKNRKSKKKMGCRAHFSYLSDVILPEIGSDLKRKKTLLRPGTGTRWLRPTPTGVGDD